MDKVGPVTWLALCMACVAAAGAAYLAKRLSGSDQPPKKWRRVGRLVGLTIYPLKSGRGLHLKEAYTNDSGLAEVDAGGALRLRDRFLVVMETDGAMVTARKFPCLLLVTVRADGPDAVLLSAPGQPDLRVKLPIGKDIKVEKVNMWHNERVETADCGDEAALWLTHYIKPKANADIPLFRLGYDLEMRLRRRAIEGGLERYKEIYPNITSTDLGTYSDLSSFMLMSMSSVEDLRKRVPADVAANLTVKQFRPTFVVEGPPPYAEDSWEWLRIGEDTIFRAVKPCTRCVLTTINPENAERNKEVEPLKTLKKYRQLKSPEKRELDGDSPVLGVNIGLRHPGIVRIDDFVYVPA